MMLVPRIITVVPLGSAKDSGLEGPRVSGPKGPEN